MRIIPIASESLGVRSMAILVETADVKILIDPGVAYAPRRFGLKPHPIEMKRIEELGAKIAEFGRKADVVIVTHYHRDHFDFGKRVPLDMYSGKIVLVKHPEEKINPRQRWRRARPFLKLLESVGVAKIEYADGREFVFGDTKVKFSAPVIHGNDERLGYVLEVFISEGDKSVLFTSDVEGFMLEEQLKFVEEMKPKVLILDGPPTYLEGRKISVDQLEVALKNMVRIPDSVELVLLDHHILRDLGYKEKFAPFFSTMEERGVRVMTYAEFIGRKPEPLEAMRKELYEKYPVEANESNTPEYCDE